MCTPPLHILHDSSKPTQQPSENILGKWGEWSISSGKKKTQDPLSSPTAEYNRPIKLNFKIRVRQVPALYVRINQACIKSDKKLKVALDNQRIAAEKYKVAAFKVQQLMDNTKARTAQSNQGQMEVSPRALVPNMRHIDTYDKDCKAAQNDLTNKHAAYVVAHNAVYAARVCYSQHQASLNTIVYRKPDSESVIRANIKRDQEACESPQVPTERDHKRTLTSWLQNLGAKEKADTQRTQAIELFTLNAKLDDDPQQWQTHIIKDHTTSV